MADDDRPIGHDEVQSDDLASLGRKLDTVAGAVAAIAGSHTELLGHVAEAEARRSHDARETAQRLGALERQILALPTPPVPPPVDPLDPFPAGSAATDLEQLRSDLTLGLDVLAQIAEGVRRLDVRIEREDGQLAALGSAVAALQDEGPALVRERLVEMAGTVQAISERLPGLKAQLIEVRDQVEQLDLAGPLDAVARDLADHLTQHTDTALAGALRVIDDRLAALRAALIEAGTANAGGIEAGAAQPAWHRLERRLDAEFDELGRRLEAIGALVERPAATTDQRRPSAAAAKDTSTDTSNGNGLEA